MHSLSNQLFESKDIFQIINCYLTPKEVSKNRRVSQLFDQTISDKLMKELLIKSQFKHPLTKVEFEILSKQSYYTLDDVLQQSRMYATTRSITLSRAEFTLPLIFSLKPKEFATTKCVDKLTIPHGAHSPWALGDNHFIVDSNYGEIYLIKYDIKTGKMQVRDVYKNGSSTKICVLQEGFIASSSWGKINLLKADLESVKLMIHTNTIELKGIASGDPCSLNNGFLAVSSSKNIYILSYDNGKLSICDSLQQLDNVNNITYLGDGLIAFGFFEKKGVTLLKFDEKSGKIISTDQCETNSNIIYPCSINDDTFVVSCEDEHIYCINYDIITRKPVRSSKFETKGQNFPSMCSLGNNIFACGTFIESSSRLFILRYDQKSGKVIELDRCDVNYRIGGLSVLRKGIISFKDQRTLYFIQVDMETGKIVNKEEDKRIVDPNSLPCALGNDFFVVETGHESLSMFKITPKKDHQRDRS